MQHLFPRRIQIAYARRLHQYGLLVIHGPPPRRPKRRQVKCAGTRTLRQYFCASCGEVSFVRYRRIVIRIEWARCTAAPCSASYGWHQKNGRRHRGTCRCRLRGKGDGQIFVCTCGHKEKLSAFKSRREKEGAGISKKDVARYLNRQKREAEEPVNNAFAKALAGIRLDNQGAQRAAGMICRCLMSGKETSDVNQIKAGIFRRTSYGDPCTLRDRLPCR